MVESNQVCNLMDQVAAHIVCIFHEKAILKDGVGDSIPDIANNTHHSVFNPASSVEDQLHMDDAGSELVVDLLVVQPGCLGEFSGENLGFKTGGSKDSVQVGHSNGSFKHFSPGALD